MLLSFARRSRSMKVAAAIAALLASAVAMSALASCVLADPPPDLPKPPKHHPIIVKASVSPPYTQVLAELPAKLVVPIELIDTDTSFLYEAFVDYDGSDPRQGPYYVPTKAITPTPATVDGGVTIVEVPLSSSDQALDPSVCHRIEVLVALSFDFQAPHTPDEYGADSVVWFYNPSGDPGGCPRYDAGGADGAFPDVASDVIFVTPPGDGGTE
jgi:hypothetical protein